MNSPVFVIDISKIEYGQTKDFRIEFDCPRDFILREDFVPDGKAVLDMTLALLDDGSVNICGNLKLKGTDTCDRCLRQTKVNLDIRISEDFYQDGTGEDGTGYSYSKDLIDTEEMLRDNLLNNFHSQSLCKSGCKGLCSICGQNLNEKNCGHKIETPQKVSPFDILKQTGGDKDGSTKKKNF